MVTYIKFVTILNPFSFLNFKDPNRQNQPFDQAPRKGGLDALRGRSLPPNLGKKRAPKLIFWESRCYGLRAGAEEGDRAGGDRKDVAGARQVGCFEAEEISFTPVSPVETYYVQAGQRDREYVSPMLIFFTWC